MCSVGALADAANRAPQEPGVYLFLGEGLDVLYVGKAGNIRRRIQQHAATGPPTSHLHRRYERVRHVRWELAADEQAAAWREADLIFALQPPFNAESGAKPPLSTRGVARAPFVHVIAAASGLVRLTLDADVKGAPARAYGCFPHLGKGMSSRIGIACSDGYVAFLRLLWAAAARDDRLPSAITRSAPDAFEVGLDPAAVRPLHDLLTGVSDRLLGDLADAARSRPAYMQPALSRDHESARGFFAAGPRLLRARRRRHNLPPGIVTTDVYRELVTAEIRDAVGLDRS